MDVGSPPLGGLTLTKSLARAGYPRFPEHGLLRAESRVVMPSGLVRADCHSASSSGPRLAF